MVRAMQDALRDAAAAAVKKYGGGAQIARALSITPAAITHWKRVGVPADRVLDVERLTGISRHVLRPDVFGPGDGA
jgi:DNA-binding transcriptional regulator YdaS (Cro superfamily)